MLKMRHPKLRVTIYENFKSLFHWNATHRDLLMCNCVRPKYLNVNAKYGVFNSKSLFY